MNNSWLRRYGRNVALAVLAVVTAVVVSVALSIPQSDGETGVDRPPNMLDQMFDLFTNR